MIFLRIRSIVKFAEGKLWSDDNCTCKMIFKIIDNPNKLSRMINIYSQISY